MTKDRQRQGKLQQPKKRSLGRVSEMQDGWLLTVWIVVDGWKREPGR